MSDNSKTIDELTLEQRKEVDEFLENYANNPSNSNKYRIGLHAYIEALIATKEKEARDEIRSRLPERKPHYKGKEAGGYAGDEISELIYSSGKVDTLDQITEILDSYETLNPTNKKEKQ